jgi:hypothetical protein
MLNDPFVSKPMGWSIGVEFVGTVKVLVATGTFQDVVVKV